MLTSNMQFFRFTSPSMLVKSSILIHFKPRDFPRKSAVSLLVGWWNRQVAEPTSLAMALKRVKGQWEAPGNLRFQQNMGISCGKDRNFTVNIWISAAEMGFASRRLRQEKWGFTMIYARKCSGCDQQRDWAATDTMEAKRRTEQED